MKKENLHIDRFAVGIWGAADYGLKMWEVWFQDYLGPLQYLGVNGERAKVYQARCDARLYAPVSRVTNEGERTFSFDFPSEACARIPNKVFQEFQLVLERYEHFEVTRLSLSWEFPPLSGYLPHDLSTGDLRWSHERDGWRLAWDNVGRQAEKLASAVLVRVPEQWAAAAQAQLCAHYAMPALEKQASAVGAVAA